MSKCLLQMAKLKLGILFFMYGIWSNWPAFSGQCANKPPIGQMCLTTIYCGLKCPRVYILCVYLVRAAIRENLHFPGNVVLYSHRKGNGPPGRRGNPPGLCDKMNMRNTSHNRSVSNDTLLTMSQRTRGMQCIQVATAHCSLITAYWAMLYPCCNSYVSLWETYGEWAKGGDRHETPLMILSLYRDKSASHGENARWERTRMEG